MKKLLIFIFAAGGISLAFLTLTGKIVWYGNPDSSPPSLPSFIASIATTDPTLSSKLPSLPPGFVPVSSVIDGDTIKVVDNGVIENVRLLGIDTPETVDPRKPVQCFGKEASEKTKSILTGQFIRLEFDPTQGNKDTYGRLLRYVFLPGGTFINRFLVAEGYAHEYTYNTPYRYQKEFRAAEAAAREARLGLWNPATCNGNTNH